MAKWRVQVGLTFGNTVDQDTFTLIKNRFRAGRDIFDTPTDTAESYRVRLNTQADADALYAAFRNFLLDPTMLPPGTLPLGQGINDPAQVRGIVSRHLCTHDDPVVQDCRTTQYSETVL